MLKKVILIVLAMAAVTTLAMSKVDQKGDLRVLIGSAVKQEEIEFIAQSRIQAYREYPYLYEGNLQEEIAHIKWFFSLPRSAAAFAYDGTKLIGVIIGTSFKDFDEHFKGSVDRFKKAQLDPEEYYYFTDIIISPAYRGRGIAKRLSKLIEDHAKDLGYKAGCCVNESHEKHPLKPSDYKGLDVAFANAGYRKLPVTLTFNWQTRVADGRSQDMDHILVYWIKRF